MEQKKDKSKMVKLLCCYGGKIQSRPMEFQLSYVGGDTKIIAVDRAAKFSEIVDKLRSALSKAKRNKLGEISVKYQLPGEDLDSLVSLIDDDDVEHMMVEYDRMQRIAIHVKPPRLRIFVFNISIPPVKPVTNPDYLFGFNKEYQPSFGQCCSNKGAYDNREQPVYNIVRKPPVPRQRMMVSMGNYFNRPKN